MNNTLHSKSSTVKQKIDTKKREKIREMLDRTLAKEEYGYRYWLSYSGDLFQMNVKNN